MVTVIRIGYMYSISGHSALMYMKNDQMALSSTYVYIEAVCKLPFVRSFNPLCSNVCVVTHSLSSILSNFIQRIVRILLYFDIWKVSWKLAEIVMYYIVDIDYLLQPCHIDYSLYMIYTDYSLQGRLQRGVQG